MMGQMMGAEMRNGRMRAKPLLAALALALSCLPLAQGAQAQSATDFPNRPIRVIVPFAAGGGNDIFARLVSAKVSEMAGQQLVIENRPAGGGRVAAEFVARQPADGYTLYVGASGNMSIAAAVYPNLSYHPTKNFTPVAMIADFPLILIVPPKLPIKSVTDLVGYAKAHTDKSNFGTTSPSFTLATELLKLKAGMPSVALPLKSSSEMVQCVNQELCLLAIVDPPPAVSQVQEGRVRALAVTGKTRSPQLPDVPTTAEINLPDVNTTLWSGVFAPAETPAPVLRRLEDLFQRAVADKEISDRIRTLGANPGAVTPDQFRARIEKEIENYSAIVKAANLKFQ